MKIKKAAAIFKEHKRCTIVERKIGTGTYMQYLTNGAAVYPLYDLPRLRKESLLTVFDIPRIKWDDWIVQVKNYQDLRVNLRDYDDEETMLEPGIYPIRLRDDCTLISLYTEENGVLFLNEKYLAPFSDVESPEYWRRRDGHGNSYVAVKSGVMVCGFIYPMQMEAETWENRWADFLNRCRIQRIQGEIGPGQADAGRKLEGTDAD